ncbi:DnaJ domain-containing protein [Novosphingobium sp.]|uniref:DnaJ domain-containing protein n=1 Tax=Novosphingobium sp. TaxID=1874826 RepID=UPI0035B24575
MGRLILFAVLAALACKGLTGKWPWELWSDSERSQQEAQARALLGVERSASREAISEAHRRLITRVHPDRGGTAEQVHAANAARDLLLARLDRQNRIER